VRASSERARVGNGDPDGTVLPVLTHVQRADVAERPVVGVTLCGKEVQRDDEVATARTLLARKPVKVVPVLDGSRYLGTVDARALEHAPDHASVGAFATAAVPAVTAGLTVGEALDVLDADGGQRLVVLAPDGVRYVGVVCLRGDRRRLCVETERLDLTEHDVATDIARVQTEDAAPAE
jgi:CBS-domain-containing membrane protein